MACGGRRERTADRGSGAGDRRLTAVAKMVLPEIRHGHYLSWPTIAVWAV